MVTDVTEPVKLSVIVYKSLRKVEDMAKWLRTLKKPEVLN